MRKGLITILVALCGCGYGPTNHAATAVILVCASTSEPPVSVIAIESPREASDQLVEVRVGGRRVAVARVMDNEDWVTLRKALEVRK